MTPFLTNDHQNQYHHHQQQQQQVQSQAQAQQEQHQQQQQQLQTQSFSINPKKDDDFKKDTSPSSTISSSSSSSSPLSTAANLPIATTTSQLVGGYESHEDYTYIRGRGRGRYVCSECGIRCKKPSMLKKHIRTHTDVRPYTCKPCQFSFKTKGNLTKHMQSKTHYKKFIELGLNPGPMPADGEFLEPDVEFDQQSTNSTGGQTTSSMQGESDSDDTSDNDSESSSGIGGSLTTPSVNVSSVPENGNTLPTSHTSVLRPLQHNLNNTNNINNNNATINSLSLIGGEFYLKFLSLKINFHCFF